MQNVYALIMAGGSGTRFWPASRYLRPKQLLPLVGDRPLISATVERLLPLVPKERIYIATGEHLLSSTAEALPNIPRSHLLAEPTPRNTAPCIGWGAATIARTDPNALIAVLPSDHFIRDEQAFRDAITRALSIAGEGYLATLGIVPTRPDTGYGYIEVGEALSAGVHRATRFVEKPNLERATEYVLSKSFVWNAGMFFFRASTMLAAIETHLPALHAGLRELDRAARTGEEPARLRELFPTFPKISIDHGIMEKADRVAVVPAEFGWSDIGSWESAWELAQKGEDGNTLPEGGVAVECRNLFVRDLSSSQGKRVFAAVGVSDLVLVETDDAVLLMPRGRAQDVRLLVDALAARGSKVL